MPAHHFLPYVAVITRVPILGPDFHMTYNNDRPDGYTRMEIHESQHRMATWRSGCSCCFCCL
ncbi:hypothetical protein PtrM4_122060 [Pyrenophora tritici-repentis]|uniref:Uncharacterized protein n=1 Tax=Pyrenophora tritici-repentis TaxID=45151 RepID=A0A834RTY2_9PLEO|nr:hypothetical protein PtrM4_122060 [Pyrenophora tritici-repentis]